MKKLHKIANVKVTPGFQLSCAMDDGRVFNFDMSFVLRESGPMIEPLRKLAFFKKVFLEMGTPTWPNGFAVCPDLIAIEGTLIKRRKRAS